MNWDDVRIFLAVARAGQILGAARRLGLNHATVSRRIAALEAALGARLFRRMTTGSELTAAGERFLGVAERMEADMIAARADLADEGDDLAGPVRIGAPDGFGVAFLAPRLGELTARHRELSIQLVPVPRSFSLSRREADIAITVERPTEGRLVASKLVDYSLGLYASRAYGEKHGLPETPAALAGHRLVGYVDDLVNTPTLD
jgi:DNA-binding transcriptional LysR family regulator